MGIEIATYLGDLVPTNPGTADLVGQGDDHIRLLKTVLQNSFPGLEKAVYFQTTSSVQTADFAALPSAMATTFRVDTTAGLINVTLPTLGPSDAGWECFMMKTSFDINPMLIRPPTGQLISGSLGTPLAAARRAIPGSRISCFWTGTGWLVGRSIGVPGPVGSCVEYHGATLPFGYEWPNGQTLASAATAYPEYSAVMGSGVTLDKRGRMGVPLDNLGGSAAGRWANGIITGTAIGNSGGVDGVALSVAQLASHTHSGTTATENANHTHTVPGPNGTFLVVGGGSINVANPLTTQQSSAESTTHAHTFTTNASGSGSVHSNAQPSIMVAQLLVVE